MTDEIANTNPETSDENLTPVEPERVSRLSAPVPPTRSNDGDEDVVREYENRYLRESKYKDEPANAGSRFNFENIRSEGQRLYREGRAYYRDVPRSYNSAGVGNDERLWAAVAHGSIWFTLLGGVASIGAVVPITVFIPLIIYFFFRNRSDFVAFHALQAFMIQIIATLGVFAFGLVGGIVWVIGMVLSLILMIALVGFILVPVWGLVGIVGGIVLATLPIIALILSTIATIETFRGQDYRYPFIARWLDQQLSRSTGLTIV